MPPRNQSPRRRFLQAGAAVAVAAVLPTADASAQAGTGRDNHDLQQDLSTRKDKRK